MTTLFERLGRMFTNGETWIYGALMLGFSLERVASHQWSDLLMIIARYALELSPILVFKAFQPALQKTWSGRRLNLLRLLVFVGYPVAILWIDLHPVRSHYFQSSDGDILLAFFLVELFLVVFHGVHHNPRFQSGATRLGFDRALLVVTVVTAFYLAALVVSDPSAWRQGRAVHGEIIWWRVGGRFGLFLQFGLQFFAVLMGGFLIYALQRHLLVKQVLARTNWVTYLAATAATILVLYPLLTQIYLWLPMHETSAWLRATSPANPFSWRYGMVVTVMMLISLPVVLALQWQQQVQRAAELEKAQMRTEIDLLKQQINPHFLFNTLNNLYALCLKKSDQAPEVVLQLSDLMRYVVYEGRKNDVLLSDEIEYLRNYIALFQLRRRQKVSFNFTVEVADPAATIAPLLLIIPVENAFKHGIEPATDTASLSLSLIEENGTLQFRCENSIEPEAATTDPGVGLTNLKRRLALRYPGRHTWTTTTQAQTFIAELTLYPKTATDVSGAVPAHDRNQAPIGAQNSGEERI